jgi:hypothetical protein
MRHVRRFAAYGALIILAAGPVVGIVISLFRWITTGDAAHGIEAITLFTVAGLMGGGGGAIYALVTHSRARTNWWYYIGFVAAMEAYLTICSVLILGMAIVTPQLVADLPCYLSQHSGVFCASSRHLRSAVAESGDF